MILMDDWLLYQPWREAFASVIDQRFYSLGWLDAEIWNGRARFWCSDDAAIVATLKVYPAGAREIHGLVAAGALDAIRDLIAKAEVWGREMGCIVAGIDSRPGWQRALAADGYALYQLGLRKEL